MKSAFSLLELIFVLVLLALIGSYAIPKYMNTKQAAVVTTVKRDIATITSSLQSYFLLHGEIDDINDALTLGNNNWQIDNKTITYKSSGQDCITIRVNEQEQELELNINETLDTICEKLSNAGIKDTKTALY
ncbi:prepilin-type cleavage/methylation domain-containing protein [Malaciobacter halophilus]|uniref:Prepilin-type cleavage/methylation domain-containing protein n=1 Tax=Malaciobacter halophilus TaxID=197482 RepID=A0A2N1J5T3_9BACT|nr:prepilin-type N-terminal cleavage/methylation domain-containing protein [Malaciobacter halophilus]AXH09185.1 type II secretion/transformation system, G protein [Malaciobacter halophilus]PKI81822.1 prepilin-type cleavage/methylation domain-containing protein [Malaciobacter halophilus]